MKLFPEMIMILRMKNLTNHLELAQASPDKDEVVQNGLLVIQEALMPPIQTFNQIEVQE